MNILQIGILVFTAIEVANVATLYFKPDSRYGNGVGVFNALAKSETDEEVHALVKYLINWVAGCKLIFIMMALVVFFWGGQTVQMLTVGALIISIASFYWRLFPTVKRLDAKGQMTPKGYSKTLGLMIAGMLIGFAAVLIVALITL